MSLTRRVCLRGGAKISKLQRKFKKRIVNLEQLEKISKKASKDGVFVEIDDPNYVIDDLLKCY